jgi:opacity protein-like surface antigen
VKKSILGTASVVALSLAAMTAPVHSMARGIASSGEYTQLAVGIDFANAIPVGNFADAAGFGIGTLSRIEYIIDESPLAVTMRTGYLWHMSKDVGPATTSFTQLPALGGLKYLLPAAPIYVAGELGAVFTTTSTEGGPGGDTDNSETSFGFGAGAGYELDIIDFRLSLNFLDMSKMADTMTLGFTIGINIWGM